MRKISLVSVPVLLFSFLLGCQRHSQGPTSMKGEKPLKIFILAGQSNMVGLASKHTLEHVKMFPETAKEFAALFDAEGNPVETGEVVVSQWNEKPSGNLAPRFGGTRGVRFGPEYGFGVYMHKALGEPFLIIKTAEGGKDINFNFRPPSAGKWVPPAGHPDLIEKKKVVHAKLPIPQKMDLPADYEPENLYLLGKRHLGLKHFKGATIGKFNGVSPIYIKSAPRDKIKGDPFMQGDLILGVDGSGLRDDPISHWREAFYSSKSIEGDWEMEITRWRKGKIETFVFDMCDTLEGGRAKLPEQIAKMKQAEIDQEKQRGVYYQDMIAYVKEVLGNLKDHHRAYDPKQGYEIAGLVWFQGYNDMINSKVYPNRDKPRGYEQYTWLMEHFIRDVRRELNTPNMPVVVGAIGLGGVQDPPKDPVGHLQQAQMATGQNSEFIGTVATVNTGKYWDHDLDALANKSNEVRKKINDFRYKQGLEGEALDQAYAKYRAKHITAEEEELLKIAISNQGFHYWGSGKIMAGIGKGFAEAMLELIQP